MVTVKFTSLFRQRLGREEDKVEAVTVADLLVELERRYGDVFKNYLSCCHIFVNGVSAAIASPNAAAKALSDGDEVLFLLLVTGG